MDIQDLRIFARVAAGRNLSAVAAELGLTPGTISKRLQALEGDLGVRLFDRTTRSIRITEEGAMFLRHADTILAELEQARAAVRVRRERPKGLLKILAPTSLGRRSIAPAISVFLGSYPELEVQVDLSDRAVNLQEEGYDLAIRVGALPDSSLVAKRLAAVRMVVVASPEYLAASGTPLVPSDIERHCCLVLGDNWSWVFQRDGQTTHVKVNGRLRSNNGEVLRQAALDGRGLLRACELRLADDIETGRLVKVLEQYHSSDDDAVWAVYPASRHVLPKMRVLIDFLAEWFRDRRCDPAQAEAMGQPERGEHILAHKPRARTPRPANA